MVCRRPLADHQTWEDYVTVLRLAAKHTDQPSPLQATLKSLALSKPNNSFSFLCFFPFLILIVVTLLWIKSELVTFAGETGSSRRPICDQHYLISQWGTGRGCCRQPCVPEWVSVCVCVCVCVRMCIVCICVRESERALNSYYIAFKLKPVEPMPSWEAVCRLCSRFRLSASPIISKQQIYCELQSSRKCHLSCLWWPKASSHGIFSQTFGNVSFSLMTVLQMHDQQTLPCSPLYPKCFYKWHLASKQICIFLLLRMHNASKSGFSKFQHKSFSNSQEKSEKLSLLLISWMPYWFLWLVGANMVEP